MATFRVHVDDDATMVGVLAERWHQDPTCNATLAILTSSVLSWPAPSGSALFGLFPVRDGTRNTMHSVWESQFAQSQQAETNTPLSHCHNSFVTWEINVPGVKGSFDKAASLVCFSIDETEEMSCRTRVSAFVELTWYKDPFNYHVTRVCDNSHGTRRTERNNQETITSRNITAVFCYTQPMQYFAVNLPNDNKASEAFSDFQNKSRYRIPVCISSYDLGLGRPRFALQRIPDNLLS